MKPTPTKGFRTAPQPTKGEVAKENQTLAGQLAEKLGGLQKFFGNLINQLMKQSKAHDQEINQLALWLGSGPTTDGAQAGDHIILDYLGALLNEDGTPSLISIQTQDGEKQIPDYFDGGAGKFFMLTNLGSGKLIPGFEEQLMGMKAGEGKKIIVQFPKEYGVKSLDDRKAEFTVYIHAVQRSYANSPVGDLIDENARIRQESRAKMVAEAQAKQAAEAAETESKPEAPATETPPASEAAATEQPSTTN